MDGVEDAIEPAEESFDVAARSWGRKRPQLRMTATRDGPGNGEDEEDDVDDGDDIRIFLRRVCF